MRGDLDNILSKALKKSPAQRYASVEAMAADIERHMVGEPVVARPDSFAYRTSRFIGRHRAGLAAAALVFTAVVAGVAGTLMQAQRFKKDDGINTVRLGVRSRMIAYRLPRH